MHEENCFITLTYNEEHLPANKSLDVREFQLFMKRLRKKYEPKKIRFYACGEYGDNLGRPHYHACLFGHDFEDKKIWRETKNKDPLYRSHELEKLWPYGYSSVGEVTFQSAAYVARYLMKKMNGQIAEDHYKWIDENGEIIKLVPEFTVMSRKPGIGKNWLVKFASDVYPDDFIIMNGKKMRPPRFYDLNYQIEEPAEIERLKKARKKNLRKHAANNTPERLAVRERIHQKKAELLKRNHDKEI